VAWRSAGGRAVDRRAPCRARALLAAEAGLCQRRPLARMDSAEAFAGACGWAAGTNTPPRALIGLSRTTALFGMWQRAAGMPTKA